MKYKVINNINELIVGRQFQVTLSCGRVIEGKIIEETIVDRNSIHEPVLNSFLCMKTNDFLMTDGRKSNLVRLYGNYFYNHMGPYHGEKNCQPEIIYRMSLEVLS